MNRIYKPYIIFATITVPQILIFVIFSKIFYIINSELSQRDIRFWSILGSYLGIACILFTIYGAVSFLKKKDINILWAGLMFITYILFLIIYLFNYSSIIPWNITNWMLSGIRPGMTILTLIMPALVHSMVILVHLTMDRYGVSISRDFIFLIGIPAFWYIFFQIIRITNFNGLDSLEKIVPILFIISIIVFLFFFVRIIVIVLKNKPQIWQKYLAVFVFFGALMGLTINQSFGNIMGDYSHYSYYILSIVTGVLMIIPESDNKKIRLGLFIAKSITFTFTSYFFIVFLPYLPLSLLGIIFIGLGILMLVPLALTFLHIRGLWSDYNYLKGFYNKTALVALFLIGVMVLPTFYMTTVRNDKENLDTALKYAYQRGYEDNMEYDLDLEGIKRALKNIKHVNGTNRDTFSMFNRGTPYLTSFYNWYVLDNLSISNRKIKELEEVFFGESDVYTVQQTTFDNHNQGNKDVFIQDIKVETEFDSQEEIFKSWIHFEIKNKSTFQNEYHTVFELPEGSYISNYYLYVGDEKKYGLIADKRAANWIYERIKSVRKDPGLLTYYDENKIDFKIFPFEGNETRKTGIEIVHNKPMILNIDGNIVELKDNNAINNNLKDIEIDPNIVYLSSEVKETLPIINRENEYYFLIDYSKDNEKNIDEYSNRIKDFIYKNKIEDSVREIIALNFEEKSILHKENWEAEFQNFKVKGGFYTDYTIKRILYNNYVNNSDKRPIIILVTDDINSPIIREDFSSLNFMAPEGLYYYNLNRNEELVRYSPLNQNNYEKVIDQADKIDKVPVLVYTDEKGRRFYLSNDNEDSIIIKGDKVIFEDKGLKSSKWESGVLLKAMYLNYIMHPENYFENSLNIVKESIINEVMSPLTSFIVLENEMQEKVMLEKQKEILATEKPIDIGDMTQMKEPSLLLIGFIIISWVLIKNRKNLKTSIK